MALPGNIDDILRNSPSSFDASSIKNSIDDLDVVIGKLKEMGDGYTNLNEEQRTLLKTLEKYKKELDKVNQNLSKTQEWANRTNERIGGFTSMLGGINDIATGIGRTIKGLAEPWGNADQAANQFAKTIGGNAKAVANLRDETMKFANEVHIGEKYNTSIKEMIELQQKYSASVGRNLQISDKQRETLLATQRVMGENTTEFAKKLENMGIGLEKSGDLAAKMFNEASKSGISFDKYSKSVTDNLTKVQSYGFRNGVEGLTAMAKKAAEVNLSINEAFKVADKIQTGGIQEAIKMGANLQVLGGSFASMGDPMGMLYQGLNDVEGLQDRMIKMFSGLGQIENGQVKISGANRLRVNAAAQAMGISNDEMFNMINRQAVRGVVDKQMKGNTALTSDEELAELVRNTATLNKNNEAVVNINGQEKKVSEINGRDKEYLKNLQKSESEDIKDIAQILRGYVDAQSGFGKEVENKKAQSFQNIGKATKAIYNILGQSNVALEVIKDAVLVMAMANMASTVVGGIGKVSGGFNNMMGRGRMSSGGGGAGGRGGGGGTSGGGGTWSISKTTSFGPGGQGTSVTNYGGKYSQRTLEKLARRTGGEVVQEGDMVLDSAGRDISGKAARVARTSKILGRAGAGVAGGAIAGVTTAIGYLADGSFQGSQSDKTKAWSGTVGSAVLGGLGTAFLGPIGGMIGAEIGKFAGEAVGKLINKARAKKKTELTKELGEGTEKAKAFASLSDNYTKAELKKIKKALADGKITSDELKPKLLKKMAKSGDKDLIEKFGSRDAKAKINKEIEKLNASVDKGNFDMQTGEFTIGNANFGAIEPVAYAKGGKVEGPSDINGPGVPTILGGNEFVVKAEYAEKNEPILNAMNSGAEFDFSGMKSMPVEPVRLASGGKPIDKIEPSKEGGKGLQMPIKISNIIPNILKSPMAPLPVRAGVAIQDTFKRVAGLENKLEVAPIKLDVSGTIKLDSNGQQVDLNAIMNNPTFLTQLSQMIERRLADNINGGNFKELRKNKQHNF